VSNAKERRVRIGDWLVPYDDATTDVVIERHLTDILHAIPGDALNCMNSRCIQAQRNSHVFPHPVFVVSTIKSRVYVVDQLDDSGIPAHAVRYELVARDRRLIDAHDRYGAGEPGALCLRIPRDPKGSPKRRASGGKGFDTGDRDYPQQTGKRRKPVTSHSLGAQARYVAAVGALKDA
jgi:hypothetical protein